MKVRVAHAQCTGHARCFAVSEELFPLDDSGYSTLRPRDVAPGDEAVTEEAAAACPEGAIVVEAE